MPGRRPLVAFVALAAFPLSACVHAQKAPKPVTPPAESTKLAARANDAPPPRILFAELPSRPGAVFPAKQSLGPSPGASTQRPANPEPKNNQPVVPIGTEPGQFPVPPATPAPEPPLLAAMREY